MTLDYILSTYSEAKTNQDKAREAERNARNATQRRDAREDIEFWGSKAANMYAASKSHGTETFQQRLQAATEQKMGVSAEEWNRLIDNATS